ncbi:MAG: hypothetical protein Q8K99_08810 [Actinomycetota bacterium]|nr:hypothetical protein [Actinomycetota bacterium]
MDALLRFLAGLSPRYAIALVGLMCFALSVAGVLPLPGTKGCRVLRLVLWQRLAFAAGAIIFLWVAIWQLDTPPVAIAINRPSEGASVERNEIISGTVRSLDANECLRLFVFSGDTDLYYPQEREFESGRDGNWNGMAHFGETGDGGRSFALIAAVVDRGSAAATSGAIGGRTSTVAPLGNLPSGIIDSCSVKVRRSANP